MRIAIAPDKFKGCLSAADVAAAIARGLRQVDPAVDLDLCPMADGGEGTVAALVAATGGRLITRPVTGPLPGTKVDATFGILGDGRTAVIEMAAASGLALLSSDQRNPMQTTTYGTGQLLLEAAKLGVGKAILGIGGSATTDGGLGAAQACGATVHLQDGTVRDADGAPLTGADVGQVVRLVPPSAPVLEQIHVACDVTNPLFGPNGAAPVYGPQKGATPVQVRQLDQSLQRLAERTGTLPLAQAPGAGAAGGLGFGMIAFFPHASLRSGIDITIDAVHLRDRLSAGADLCITAEGRFDAQSLSGKTPVGVARLCKSLGVPCIVLAGSVAVDPAAATAEGVSACFCICDGPQSLEDAMARCSELLCSTSAQVLRTLRLGRP